MDLSISEGLNDWGTASRVVEAIAEFLAQQGVVLLVALVAAVALGVGRWRSVEGRRGAAAAAVAGGVALLLATVISGLVDRTRPFVDHPQIHLLIHHAKDAGFPSDHATGSFAIATALALHHRRAGVAALVLATLISLSRVIVGAHYISDVAAGAVLGIAIALLVSLRPIRSVTDAVADRVGGVYDRLVGARLPGPGRVSA